MRGALAQLNAAFLDAHAEARQERCRWLETRALVLRYASGTLEARYRGAVILPATNVLPPAYHPLKDVSHSLFLAALVAAQADSAQQLAQKRSALTAIDGVLAELSQPGSPAVSLIGTEHVERQRRILGRARAALHARNVADAHAELRAARGDLEANLSAVTAATLRGLHAAVQTLRRKLESEHGVHAWSSLLVVIGVVHQARAGAPEIRYFERLLREQVEEGASREQRLVIAEDVSSAARQYGLLSMHLVDQLGGEAVFGEPTRLQRDVLSGHTDELDRLLPP